ncbi:MAG: hypothetical protein ACKO4W_07200, partial [Bacteroidota bacterium]
AAVPAVLSPYREIWQNVQFRRKLLNYGCQSIAGIVHFAIFYGTATKLRERLPHAMLSTAT